MAVRLFDGVTSKGVGALDFFDTEDGGNQKKINIEMVEKWWCLGGTENRLGMWVHGRCVPNARGSDDQT